MIYLFLGITITRNGIINRAITPWVMPRWKKDAKEFPVVVNHIRDKDAYSCSLPKPLVEYLGKPDNVVFKIKKNGEVSVG